MPFVAGVDGCRGGWAVALLDPQCGTVALAVVGRLQELMAYTPGPGTVAVDMPIGLPERCGPGGRGPERLVRPLLGARQSSVFSIPSRAAVEAADYRLAREAALATSDPPRSVAKQAYCLFPKILELDALLRAGPPVRIVECHPEVSFRMMKGAPLVQPKRAGGSVWPPGLDERRALLAAQGLDLAGLPRTLPGAGEDDLVDACAAAWTAARVAAGTALCHPPQPERDRHGLEMAIWS